MTASVPTTTSSNVEVTGSAVELDELSAVLTYLREVTERHRHYAELRRKTEAMVKAALGDAEVGTVDGEPVVTYKSTERIAVSHRLLVQRYPAIARECEDITSVRTFRLLD